MPQAAVNHNVTTPAFATDAERWAAVLRRDSLADGAFYYSVSTTGVYCRPSCGSRQAKREHVRFHLTREEAERAGFRPCKRCRPADPARQDLQARAVARACRLIETTDELPSLEKLAETAGLSRFHFHRLFKAVTGLTPRAYAVAHRANRVRSALPNAGSVTEAIYDAGFNSSGRFYAASSSMLGMQPKAFRSGGDGTAIRFAVGECSLGSILVAATDKGVCSILLGDDPDALVQDLEQRFPKAELTGGDKTFDRLVATVVGLIEQPGREVSLPLDIQGTAFQQRVWHALREIPAGKTMSYAELAGHIGTPHAVRAVAGACAANKIAVAIPCHRVVRLDGSLSGYRWGVERKKALLDREARRV